MSVFFLGFLEAAALAFWHEARAERATILGDITLAAGLLADELEMIDSTASRSCPGSCREFLRLRLLAYVGGFEERASEKVSNPFKRVSFLLLELPALLEGASSSPLQAAVLYH